MTRKRLLFAGLAVGLLALGGAEAYLRLARPAAAVEAAQWVCPMRCLNRLHDGPGECPVCRMKLVRYRPAARKLIGYTCPLHRSEKVFDKGGTCPFCGLTLKELYDGPPPPLPMHSGLRQWPLLEGRTAVFYRPYEVRSIAVESIVRGAGPLRGRRLELRLPRERRRGLAVGSSAMVMPPRSYARPVTARVTELGPGGRVVLALDRPIPGSRYATAELRLESPAQPAVPLAALLEDGGRSRVFVMDGESFAPRDVTVTVRGESYAALRGVEPGESVAGAGVFWLDAAWRMEHP